MKRTFNVVAILLLLFLLFPVFVNSQVDNIFKECKQRIRIPFINSGQPMQAFLTGDEVAQFRATLFDGNTYRIVTCSPDNQKIWFSVYDQDHNLLFASNQYQTPSLWDFKMEGTLDCIIEAGLAPGTADSGMALLMMGFTSSELVE